MTDASEHLQRGGGGMLYEWFCGFFGGHRFITAWSPSEEYEFCLYCRKGMPADAKRKADKLSPHTEECYVIGTAEEVGGG